MTKAPIPSWAEGLSEEDWHFVKRFILASGSLKQLAMEYGVTYPTLRLRLDRLIRKVQALDISQPQTPFHRTLQLLVAEGKLNIETARMLMKAFDESSEIREE